MFLRCILHYCTIALNLHVLTILQDENREGRLRTEGEASAYVEPMTLPGPIAEYISHVGKTSAQAGDVRFG